jgi:hypothetical protein
VALSPGRTEALPEEKLSANLLDAVAEIVHQGYGRLFDLGELRADINGWKSHRGMNVEYVFA